jgi:hypothetical protein
MSSTRKKPEQLKLFAGRGEIHELGLLGWEDSLWTKRFEVTLLGGQTLTLDLATVRRLQRLELPARASSAGEKLSRS